MAVTLMLFARQLKAPTSARAEQVSKVTGNIVKTLMNVTWITMVAVYMSATTYQEITDALVMMVSIWHMMDTIVWMWMSVSSTMVGASILVSTLWAATNAAAKTDSSSVTTSTPASTAQWRASTV